MFQEHLRQKYYARKARREQGSNPWHPDHDSTFHLTVTPALTTQPSVTSPQQKYSEPQVQHNCDVNLCPPDHDSTFHVTVTPALTTRPSVTSLDRNAMPPQVRPDRVWTHDLQISMFCPTHLHLSDIDTKSTCCAFWISKTLSWCSRTSFHSSWVVSLLVIIQYCFNPYGLSLLAWIQNALIEFHVRRQRNKLGIIYQWPCPDIPNNVFHGGNSKPFISTITNSFSHSKNCCVAYGLYSRGILTQYLVIRVRIHLLT